MSTVLLCRWLSSFWTFKVIHRWENSGAAQKQMRRISLFLCPQQKRVVPHSQNILVFIPTRLNITQEFSQRTFTNSRPDCCLTSTEKIESSDRQTTSSNGLHDVGIFATTNSFALLTQFSVKIETNSHRNFL